MTVASFNCTGHEKVCRIEFRNAVKNGPVT